jgi:hypothetical protein
MKTKLMVLTVVVLLTIVCGTVQAQKNNAVSFKGVEISTGHVEPGEAYGWMCYAKTTGTFPGNFTLTMDYAAMKEPGTQSDVIGGSWTLPVYATTKYSLRPSPADAYQGVLFGNVEGGVITWDKLSTTMELKMNVSGGTQGFSEYRGTATLYGTLIYDEKGNESWEGTIYFQFK